MTATAGTAARRDALVERLFTDAIGAFDLLSVYLGDVLGLYRALADEGPPTSAKLAGAAGIHERYAREWLEHQAASSLLELEPNGDARRYGLPEGHDEALLDSSSLTLTYIAPLARSFAGAVKPLEGAGRSLPQRRRSPLRRLRRRPARRPGGLQEASVREPAREGVATRPAGGARASAGRPAGPRRRHRLRPGPEPRQDVGARRIGFATDGTQAASSRKRLNRTSRRSRSGRSRVRTGRYSGTLLKPLRRSSIGPSSSSSR